MTVNYLPVPLLLPGLLLASILVVGGQLLALIAVLYLRRSFAVFVELRAVVLTGPYRYVRHPMYAGYILMAVGLLASNLSAGYALISTVHVGLFIYRARLEERLIAGYDQGYRSHMARTGFLFPKLSRSR